MNTTYGTPAGSYGSDPADPPPSDGFSARARKKRWFRWGAGITLASFLAGGGIALAVVSGSSTAAPTPVLSSSGSAQAAELNTELSARQQLRHRYRTARPVGAGPAAPSRRCARRIYLP